MKIQTLDESWRIVIVVTPQNTQQLRLTLEDVQLKSLHPRISVLAADTPATRDATSELSLPIEYNLPRVIDSGAYWTTVVSNHSFDCDRTIFLLAGTRVPEHWDARLAAAGQRATAALAISPQCARHPILSAFAKPNTNPELPVDDIDQWLNDYVDGIEYSVPVILESCALLQGSYWRDRAFAILNDRQLFEDLRVHGACLLATDQLYIDDSSVIYFEDVSFLPKAYLDACLRHPPLAQVRHALSELLHRRERPNRLMKCLPVQLHIGHSWGGGLERWMEDYIAADAKHNHLVLRSIGDLTGFGQTINLFHSTDMDVPVKTWMLCEPIISINMSSFEYRGILQELVERYNVESIVISSLVGHSLDLLRTPLPTTVVLHDYFPFCPAIYATFESPCISCDEEKLRLCSRENPRHLYFKFETNEHWIAIRREFVRLLTAESITVIAPTQSVIDRYRQLAPSLSEKPIHVVAHGLNDAFVRSLNAASGISSTVPKCGDRLKIVMLGRLTEEKGGELLVDIVGQITSIADVFLLGTGESGMRFNSVRGITVRAAYKKEDLGSLLREIRPDFGMLLSTVPETFSYTLSELWAAGIPVLATRIGAFADRISDARNGWLIEPNVESILGKLHLLDSDRHSLSEAREFVAGQQIRTATRMVEEYDVATPDSGCIPALRYNLPRRSHRNPYRQNFAGQGTSPLYVNPLLSYSQVLAEFLNYTSQKLEHSPKLPHWLGKILGRSIRRTSRYLG